LALEIIRKEERTDEDLRVAFEILFHSDGTATREMRFDEVPDMNKLLNSLQLCSKSRLLLCLMCAFKFKCSYLLKERGQLPEIARIGANLHLAGEFFWSDADKRAQRKITEVNHFLWRKSLRSELLSTPCDFNAIKRAIRRKYASLVPEQEPRIGKLRDSFVDFEANRIFDLFSELGHTGNTFDQYVKPVACELPIENWGNGTMGIVDRIDRISNDAYAIVEYKYGKPKYFGINWQRRNIMKELCFYRILLEGKKVYVIEQDTHEATPLMELFDEKPLPYYGAMVFFQDIEKTALLKKLDSHSMRATRNALVGFWTRINTGSFNPTPIYGRKSDCYDWCDHYDGLCEFNALWDLQDFAFGPDNAPRE